jgi:hypothetical protein
MPRGFSPPGWCWVATCYRGRHDKTAPAAASIPGEDSSMHSPAHAIARLSSPHPGFGLRAAAAR